MPPTPVRIGGRSHLAYELHVTSLRPADVSLLSVQVLDADSGAILSELRDADLQARIGRPGLPFDKPDKQLLSPGTRAVVFFWMPVQDDARMPKRLRHRLEFDLLRTSGRERIEMHSAPLQVQALAPLVLGAPLRGGPWVALYDPTLMGGHRTSIYTMDGRARIPARYAIDFVRLGEDASRARGDVAEIGNWHGYGAEVLAVADSVVADAADDMTEAPELGASSGPLPLENHSGNYVTLDLGGGRFAFYEHLKHGSVRVKVGERITRGQVIGLLGNSGSSSSGPHLHFHVSDANAAHGAEGQPYTFERFSVVGAYDTIGAHTTGEPWKPMRAPGGGARTRELPAANSVVRFD
ncbi:MAG TPA: M23 family metallopeptidase [Steroidobacteraceae bacterium]|nr:M23 family metallopeptidase [Steroidobacteraceae bacterium]